MAKIVDAVEEWNVEFKEKGSEKKQCRWIYCKVRWSTLGVEMKVKGKREEEK